MCITIFITIILLAVKDGHVQAASGNGSLLSIFNPVGDPVADKLDALVPDLGPEDPDADLDFPQLAAKYGHPAEDYVVYTKDGYRLKVFHLPGRGHGYPVLLFHGILDSADTWIIRGNESLAITLANAGYDVWLGNVRGNKYSVDNASAALDLDEAFWNFTFHEHGVYDLPTTIDLVLNKTGAAKLDAVVHSQGSTIFFVLLSAVPEYNDKVNLLITLAPVVYLQHSPPPLGIVLRLTPAIYKALKQAQQYQVFSATSASLAVVRLACSTSISAYVLCLQTVVYPFVGYDVTQIDPAFSVVVFKHTPTATSSKNLLHFGQIAIRREFAPFDYGPVGNSVAYGSVEPPRYKLENVRARVVLLTARNDFLSTQPDVALLRRRLPNVVRFVVNPRRQMNHLDYVWGQNMSTYLCPYILESLQKYRPK